jgi:hypothetical protein
METFLKKHHKIIVAAILSVFFVISLLNAKNDSATFDEVAHIPAGFSYVEKHDMRLNPEHPPLLKDLIGFPLLFLNLNFDTNTAFWKGEFPRLWDDGQWVAGKHLLYEAGNNPDQILFWSRLPIIIISVLLGLFLFMWAKELAGITAGLFTLVLYAFDPNVLGHNHFVTTDLGIAAFLTFAFYFFIRFIKNPSWKNVFIGGFFLGLANLTKFSSLIAYPILGLVLFLYPLIKKISHYEKEDRRLTLRLKEFINYLGKGAIAFAFSMAIVWILYAINTYDMPKEVIDRQISFSFPTSDYNPKSIYTNQILSIINSHDLTRPFAEYLLGVSMVFKRVAGGNGAYFLGNVSSKASAAYFPIVFVLKETIPFLALIIFALSYAFVQFIKNLKSGALGRFKRFLQTEVTSYTLFGFIFLYSLMSITGNLNIGFRHLFPIIPLAFILVTKKIFEIKRGANYHARHQILIMMVVVLAWITVETSYNYPNYTSYFNESIGGSKNGYKYVTDSNTDWGQDLKRLKKFLDENPGIKKINTDYFGGGNPEYYLGEKYASWWDSKRPVESGWYAISANSLQTSIYDKTNKNPDNNYAWTNNFQPVTIIGDSILIYHIP